MRRYSCSVGLDGLAVCTKRRYTNSTRMLLILKRSPNPPGWAIWAPYWGPRSMMLSSCTWRTLPPDVTACILTVSSMRRTQKVKPISLSFASFIFQIFYFSLCWLPPVSTRRVVSRWNLRHSEEGWRSSTGWKLHLHLDCEARLCSSKGWRQLPDLGLPLPCQRFTRHFLWAYWSPSHL